MAGNGIERTLGTIIAKLDAGEERDKNFREDVKELYSISTKNGLGIGKAHTRLNDMKDDISDMKKKSAGIGGLSGLSGGAVIAFLKDFFMGGS